MGRSVSPTCLLAWEIVTGSVCVIFADSTFVRRRKCEERMNSFPNFMATVAVEKEEFKIHFLGLFSERADAVPIVLFHGWPGRFPGFHTFIHANEPYRKFLRIPADTIFDETEVLPSEPAVSYHCPVVAWLRFLFLCTATPRILHERRMHYHESVNGRSGFRFRLHRSRGGYREFSCEDVRA
jgi:hypothetical protein